MKKTYMIPTIQVVEMQLQRMLADSTPGLGGQYTGGTPEAAEYRELLELESLLF